MFAKNPDNSILFTDAPLAQSALADPEGTMIELLANEFPALTYAAGHREVKSFNQQHNIDIRQAKIRIKD